MVSSRKRTIDEVSGDGPEEPSLLHHIRNMWQFANLCQWIYIFGKVVKIDERLDTEVSHPDAPYLSRDLDLTLPATAGDRDRMPKTRLSCPPRDWPRAPQKPILSPWPYVRRDPIATIIMRRLTQPQARVVRRVHKEAVCLQSSRKTQPLRHRRGAGQICSLRCRHKGIP